MSNSYEHLLPPSWKTQVVAWLAEDTPSFDYGGYVVGEIEREAYLFGKGSDPAVLAGSPFFTEVFAELGCKCVDCDLQEGTLPRLTLRFEESCGTSRKGRPSNP